MTKKYLLTTGECTEDYSEYILDLIRLYLIVEPGDIPGNLGMGFKKRILGIPKKDILGEVQFRLESLIRNLSKEHPGLELGDVEMQTETNVIFSVKLKDQEKQYEFEIEDQND